VFIYLITNTINGKYYVGQTCRKPQARLRAHFAAARGGSPWRLHSAMRKYPVESFVQDVIAVVDTQEQADSLEKLWIALLDAMNFEVGYNASPGGDLRSRESAAKAGVTMTGAGNPNFGKTWSADVKQRMSEGRKGKCVGHIVTEATREKIRAKQLARVRPESEVERLRNLRKGATNSAESNEKRRITLTGKYVGERASMFGRKHTEEWKAQQSARSLASGVRPPSWLGRHHSPETIAKMRATKLAKHAAKAEALNG
jgi:group I intron endonuclease